MHRVACRIGRWCTGWMPVACASALVLLPGPSGVALWERDRAFAIALAIGTVLALQLTGRCLLRARACRERVLVIGRGPLVDRLMADVAWHANPRCFVVGVVNGPEDDERSAALSDLAELVRALGPHRIVIAGSRRDLGERRLLEWRLRGIVIEEAVSFFERMTGRIAIEALSPATLVLGDGFEHSDFVPSDLSLAVTRAFNIAAALVALAVSAPLLAAIALAVRLDSRGPVLFVQTRTGQGGQPFGLLKFRTMADGTQTSLWVRDNEHRITRVGKWLRRFRLDELPQFINVLRGEMNLVGPRPHPQSNHQLFLERIPYYWLRSSVRPGITGWAQVRYGYANTLEEETEKMRYDLYYIKHRSLGLDLRILVRTVMVLLFNSRSHTSVTTTDVQPSTARWALGAASSARLVSR